MKVEFLFVGKFSPKLAEEGILSMFRGIIILLLGKRGFDNIESEGHYFKKNGKTEDFSAIAFVEVSCSDKKINFEEFVLEIYDEMRLG